MELNIDVGLAQPLFQKFTFSPEYFCKKKKKTDNFIRRLKLLALSRLVAPVSKATCISCRTLEMAHITM